MRTPLAAISDKDASQQRPTFGGVKQRHERHKIWVHSAVSLLEIPLLVNAS